MAFDLLPALRPREWRSVICVRVCRKWEYRGGTDDGPVQHVDLVLIDEKGNSMYGEIPAQEVASKSPLIEEGGIYVISRFRVSNAKSGYRPVDSRYMIEFTLRTVVSAPRTDLPDFPRCVYKITPISNLPSHAGDTRNFLDTIGLLVEKSDAYMVHLPNKPAPTLTRHVILRDLSYCEMKVTLWGERADAFNTDAVNNGDEDKPIVVLFVGCLVKSYQGTYYLSANAASRWYFNPPIPEARQYYTSLHNQRIQVRSVPAPAQQQDQARAAAPLEEKTLRELNLMDPYEFAENGYRCTVTIGRLVPNMSWWFPSCTRCSKSCVVDGAGYRCNPCANTSFRFKYKLCFIALDGTDEAEMICFGDVARRMVGKPVQQVLRAATAPNTYPADITKLVSLRFTFQVVLTQQSYYREQKTYQVANVVTSFGHQNAIVPAAGNGDGGPPAAGNGDGGPPAAGNGAGGPPAAGNGDGASNATQGEEAQLAVVAGNEGAQSSPSSTTDDDPASPTATNTPPPTVRTGEAVPIKKQASGVSGRGKRSSAQRKLVMDAEDAEKTLPDESMVNKDPVAGAKRTRGASSVAQESG